MKLSNNFSLLRIHFECSGDITKFLMAYQDKGGVWTIGGGTTRYPGGNKVKEGDTCTEDEAMLYMQNDALHIEEILPQNISQGLFDACGDFAYNLGIGAFKSSTLYANIHSGKEIEKHNFTDWDKEHINGKLVEVDGILRRRLSEYYLAINGVNSVDFCTQELKNLKNI